MVGLLENSLRLLHIELLHLLLNLAFDELVLAYLALLKRIL